MPTKKTIPVRRVIEKVNIALAQPDSQWMNEDVRKGMCSLLDTILHDTDNYAGFNYVDWMNGGYSRWKSDGEPLDKTPYLGKEYRRFYYTNPELKK